VVDAGGLNFSSRTKKSDGQLRETKMDERVHTDDESNSWEEVHTEVHP
jgi:hypothetical protein